ncbi:hypothetical protein G9Q97_21335 [Cyclobacterium sp. GBPx2]|uniref:Uncharacterized protein n=1 Tax=Cyclobacterium plantarum TaxID=2716263 RepID=A0ABX0HEJ2_9BACT|nr:hypothetical protein [Cyclobacterium plantarum]
MVKWTTCLIICILGLADLQAQQTRPSERSTLYFIMGTSGSNIRELNEMLAQKGISNLRGGYNTMGLGYQYRLSDFILGFELLQNNGSNSYFRDYTLDHRTSRFYMNIGYSLTEEGKFHLVHYMSLGAGYLNFQMLRDQRSVSDMGAFLDQPEQGFLIRKHDIQKGTHHFGGFLTEIGFQFGYDLPLPGLEENLSLLGKFGYSFSPFEGAWNMNGITFDNLQSGAFFRLGAGVSLSDQKLFFPDAGIGVHFFYGKTFKNPKRLNAALTENGMQPFKDTPGNLGMKILGENRGRLYGVDVFNISNSGRANENYQQSLNSLRVYGNYGIQLYKRRNLELGILAGMGIGSLRYSLEKTGKPNFPLLFEEPDHDGYLRKRGLMSKGEMVMSYAMPVFKNLFRIVYAAHAGYEVPLSRYRLGEITMANYMSGPYVQFGLGLRP